MQLKGTLIFKFEERKQFWNTIFIVYEGGRNKIAEPLADLFNTSLASAVVLPLGYHTLGIECKGVPSIGVDRMLVGNRVGVGLTRSTINSFAPILISHYCLHGS